MKGKAAKNRPLDVPRHIKDLIPDPENRRVHNERNVEMVADALASVGAARSIVIDERNVILAGNGVTEAAAKAGITRVRVIDAQGDELIAVRRVGLSSEKKRALAMFDNRAGELAQWSGEQLAVDVEAGLDLSPWFTETELARLVPTERRKGHTDPDDLPATRATSIRAGELFELGKHRVICGDSTRPEDIARVTGGTRAHLLHADPPYGMGKQADGVENDNIYGAKLDAFQMSWWQACRPNIVDNASAYIWGNAPDLWRLWYCGGLGESERLELRNEIVWDKKNIAGMASPDLTQFPEASERCLFFQVGQQFIGNINADDFPEQWEPLRAYLASEAEAAGMNAKDLKTICGVGMFGHWFTRSQFTLIPEKHYKLIAAEYRGRFKRPWSELKREWVRVRGSARDVIKGHLAVSRSYFNNAHDVMRDVWEFPRVIGAERYDHATPKPVAMMERVMQSSLPEGGICLEPFNGSGSTLMGAELTGRICYAVELTPV